MTVPVQQASSGSNEQAEAMDEVARRAQRSSAMSDATREPVAVF
jgi:hypothetical protein